MMPFLNNLTDTFEESDFKKNAFKVFVALKSLETHTLPLICDFFAL